MSKKKKDIKVICETCKEVMGFHMHDCGKTISMYFGCVKCDNYCLKCKPNKEKNK